MTSSEEKDSQKAKFKARKKRRVWININFQSTGLLYPEFMDFASDFRTISHEIWGFLSHNYLDPT